MNNTGLLCGILLFVVLNFVAGDLTIGANFRKLLWVRSPPPFPAISSSSHFRYFNRTTDITRWHGSARVF